MKSQRMSEQFKAMIQAPGTIEIPGCYDVCSALILEKVGFKSVFVSGYGVAASFLGKPDIGLTTLTETCTIARNIIDCLEVPVVVDIDDGYGSEVSVLRTVQAMEDAGAAAVVMEDQVSPKRCGHSKNKQVLPLPDFMKKLEYALKSRRTGLCVIARTDEMNLDNAIARAKAFHEAGADVTLIDGLQSMDAVKKVADEVPGPKQINLIYGGKTTLFSLKELEELGYKIVVYSTPALFITAHALFKAMTLLHQTHDLKSLSNQSLNLNEFTSFIEENYLKKLNSGNLKS